MIKVKTLVGEVECPEGPYGPRTRWWAEALSDRMRTDELYALVAAVQEEAYKIGTLNGVARLIGGFDGAFSSIVDVPAEVVCDEGELAELAERSERAWESAVAGGVAEEAPGDGDDVPGSGGSSPSGSEPQGSAPGGARVRSAKPTATD